MLASTKTSLQNSLHRSYSFLSCGNTNGVFVEGSVQKQVFFNSVEFFGIFENPPQYHIG